MAEATYEKSPAREYFESIVIAVILALFVRTFVVQAFKIPSGSMEDNLLVGDHLLRSVLELVVLPHRQATADGGVQHQNRDDEFEKRLHAVQWI